MQRTGFLWSEIGALFLDLAIISEETKDSALKLCASLFALLKFGEINVTVTESLWGLKKCIPVSRTPQGLNQGEFPPFPLSSFL